MKTTQFDSVWDAIEDTSLEAASMQIRSTLVMELAQVIDDWGLTQAQAATLFGVTQPRISDLKRGKINLFSLDMLINMASTVDMAPVIKLGSHQYPSFEMLVS
jgi:predicted XRE-type DNA-binding protein